MIDIKRCICHSFIAVFLLASTNLWSNPYSMAVGDDAHEVYQNSTYADDMLNLEGPASDLVLGATASAISTFNSAIRGGLLGIESAYATARSWLVWLAGKAGVGEASVKEFESWVIGEGMSYLIKPLMFGMAYAMINLYLGVDTSGFLGSATLAGTAGLGNAVVNWAFERSGTKQKLSAAAQKKLEDRVNSIISARK